MNNDPIWRFYKPSTGTHFYTADPAEMNRYFGASCRTKLKIPAGP